MKLAACNWFAAAGNLACLLALGLLVASNVSCGDSNRPLGSSVPPAATKEISFAGQAAIVRAGKSDQIRVDHQVVSDDDLKHLAGLEDRLRRINLSQTTITDAGLAKMAEMKHLVQLRLAAPKVTDAGVAPLKNLPDLKHLHLIDVPLGDAGLAQLHDLKGLESLYLDGIRASDEAIGQLIEALPGVHLHVDGGHHQLDHHGDEHSD